MKINKHRVLLPYYSSLDYKMEKQLEEELEQGKIDEIHAESLAIDHQAELNNISTAETMLKLASLKNALQEQQIKNKNPTIIPTKLTNAPELSKIEKYEIKIQKEKLDKEKQEKLKKNVVKEMKQKKLKKNVVKEMEDIKETKEKQKKLYKEIKVFDKVRKNELNKIEAMSSNATTADTESLTPDKLSLKKINEVTKTNMKFFEEKKQLRALIEKNNLIEQEGFSDIRNKNLTGPNLNRIRSLLIEKGFAGSGLKKKKRK